MPTTVKQLLINFNILEINKVIWGESFFETEQGLYIVSTSDVPQKHNGISETISFNNNQLELWIEKLPDFLIDSLPVKISTLKKRLSEFWFPDESILYIGKAPKRKKGSGISKRVEEYYKTQIGDGSPHSGGQWIKVLKNLDSIFIYYCTCNYPGKMEDDMLDYFIDNVSNASLSKIRDKALPLPYANIRHKNRDKNHGMRNQRC